MQERIAHLTSALVEIPTHEFETEAQEYLAETLRVAGFGCELVEVSPQRVNLLARRGSGGTFFCSHIDTHPPHAHPDAFTCRRQGDHLVGRGVVDTKGLIAALIAAVETEPRAPATILITCDEERGGIGSEHASIPAGPWFDEGGIILEPTNFAVCVAQPGNVDVYVEVSAPPVHAYARDRPGSPITAVLAVIEELDTCTFSKAQHPLVGRAQRNVGRIRAGEHAWRTPARARLEMTLGVVPGCDVAEAEEEVRTRLADVADRWGKQGTSFLFDIVDRSQPSEVAHDLPIAERIATAFEMPLEVAGMPYWTDAGNLLHHHGLSCVVFGAGDLAAAHSNHEWVSLTDLERLARGLGALLRNGGTAR
jgi:acetylornithine deacetylase/succinyl-diaminopimelate desuccinylase-like protein